MKGIDIARDIFNLLPNEQITFREILHKLGGINHPNMDLPINVHLQGSNFVVASPIRNITIDNRAREISIGVFNLK